MIVIKIDVKKIDKELLFRGERGVYLDLKLMDRPDEYENDGYVVQNPTKEKREAGVKGPIIGNWRNIETAKPKPKPAPQKTTPSFEEMDDIPF